MNHHNTTDYNFENIILLAVSFVPLLVINSFIFPFVTSKALVFFLLVQLALLFIVFHLRTQIKFSITPLSLLLGCFFIFLAVSTIVSNNFHISFWSDVERMEGLYAWIHLILFFIGVAFLFTEKNWYSFFKLTFIASSIVSLLGIAQRNGTIPLLNEEGRVDVLFGNPTFLSFYLLFHIGIGLILLARVKSNHARLALWLSLSVHVLVLFYTGTRSALLALLSAIAVGCFIYAISDSVSTRIRYACIAVILTVITAFGSLLLFNDHPLIASHPVLERFSVISISNIQNQARYYIWESALEGIAEKPVWGNGLESFGTVFNTYVNPSYFGEGLSSLPEPWVDRAHNIFLEIGSSAGVLSLILFFMIGLYTLFILYTTEHLRNLEKSILIAMLASYTVYSLFSINTIIDFILLLVLVAYANSLDTRQYVKVFTFKKSSLLVMKIVCISLLLFMFVLNGNRMIFTLEARSVLDRTNENIENRFFEYATLSKRHFVDRHYIFPELPFLGTRLLATQSVSNDKKIELIEAVRAAEVSYRTFGRIPIKDLYFFGQFYRMSGEYNDANRILTKAYTYTTQNQFILMELGKTAIDEGKYEKATAYLERAYLLEPTYEEALILYATTLVHSDRIDEANVIVQNHFGEGTKAMDKILEFKNK